MPAAARVRVTKPGKELFAEDGITKAEFVDYHRTVARWMLPHLRGRPVSLQRCPDGYDGKSFFHKRVPGHYPDWIARAEVAKEGGSLTMPLCQDEASLAYLANQAAITLHPWLSRIDRPEQPDRLVFDLDPPGDDSPDPSGEAFAPVRRAAFALRELLAGIGLEPVVMTTGSRGAHVVVPLAPEQHFEVVRGFARRAADLLAARDPDRLTTQQRKEKRRGRLYLDIQRNAYAQTAVAPYSVRALRGAPVATPLEWEELADPAVGPQHWNLRTIPERLAGRGDPWQAMSRRRRSLAAAARRLDELSAAE